MATCRIRGSRAEVICPKLPAFNATTGTLNRVWFRTLKASNRVSSFTRSRIGKVLQIPVSRFQPEGPSTTFFPALPNVPAACFVNTEVLNHRVMDGLERFQSPVTLGRSAPRAVRDTSVPSVTDSQAPRSEEHTSE